MKYRDDGLVRVRLQRIEIDQILGQGRAQPPKLLSDGHRVIAVVRRANRLCEPIEQSFIRHHALILSLHPYAVLREVPLEERHQRFGISELLEEGDVAFAEQIDSSAKLPLQGLFDG